ncbi:MAG: B12-binding domain-containing radical SAM protein [Proteobacteria bacterium]|nr:B12-binding domain-containing radical SAM protein [Pseudomonadota bacterium]
MKVLFIFPHVEDRHKIHYPFGLAGIVSVTIEAGHEVEVVTVFDRSDDGKAAEAIERFGPRVIGFSAVSSQFRHVKRLAELARRLRPEAICVCGGVHPTIFPESLLEAPGLDGVFVGESEQAFIDFLDRLERGDSYRETDNFGYRKGDRVMVNRLQPLVRDLDRLPFPNKSLFQYGRDVFGTGALQFLFSRGCPFGCAYCSNHSLARVYGRRSNRPRYRAPENCIREIEETRAEYPEAREVLIWDDNFGLDRAWRRDFLDRYCRRIDLKFSCLVNPLLADREFFQALKDSGCYLIRMGVETGNESLRRAVLNRPISNSRICRAFDLARTVGLETFAYNMIGVPGETEETLRETVRMNRFLEPAFSAVQIYHPYRGTKLGDYCFEKGLVDVQGHELLSNERTRSVLRFPEAFLRRLRLIRTQWWTLVHDFERPYDPAVQMELDPARADPYGRHGFRLSLPLPPREGDSEEKPYYSRYYLYEDDRELFPPHSSHREISDQGRGAFSHWGGELYFSTSDNSDPSRNGRSYVLKPVPLEALA